MSLQSTNVICVGERVNCKDCFIGFAQDILGYAMVDRGAIDDVKREKNNFQTTGLSRCIDSSDRMRTVEVVFFFFPQWIQNSLIEIADSLAGIE